MAVKLRNQLLFQRRAAERDMRDVDQQQLLLARVVAAFVNMVAGQLSGRDAQGLDNQRRQGGLVVVQRELELGQTQHGGVLWSGSVFRIKGLILGLATAAVLKETVCADNQSREAR